MPYLPLDQAWTNIGWAQKAVLCCHGLERVPQRALQRAEQARILVKGCLLGLLGRLLVAWVGVLCSMQQGAICRCHIDYEKQILPLHTLERLL